MASPPDVFAPAKLGPLTLRNRIIKAATFEGMAEDNLVSDRLIDFHRAAAAGGLGMTTVVEGVDSFEQLAMVRRWGCDQAQGFLLGPPVHAGDVHGLLSERQGPARKIAPQPGAFSQASAESAAPPMSSQAA